MSKNQFRILVAAALILFAIVCYENYLVMQAIGA